MYKVDVYPLDPRADSAKIEPLGVKRDWALDPTGAEYHCFPTTLANRFGWGVSFPEDITLVWDGDLTPHNKNSISILAGTKFCWPDRGKGIVSLDTNLVFRSDEDTSLLTIPVPNGFIDGLQIFTSILTTSFFTGSLPIVLQLSPNKVVHIPAGTAIASLIPISVKQFDNATAIIHNKQSPFRDIHNSPEYVEGLKKLKGEKGDKLSKSFSKGEDHLGNKIGKHEIDRFTFTVRGKTEKWGRTDKDI
jgi:hypothetical protein